MATKKQEDTKPDETIPGGRYLVNGELVDANGVLIGGEKGEDAAASDDQPDPVS